MAQVRLDLAVREVAIVQKTARHPVARLENNQKESRNTKVLISKLGRESGRRSRAVLGDAVSGSNPLDGEQDDMYSDCKLNFRIPRLFI